MATAATIPTTQRPTCRQRRRVRELARLGRATVLYERRGRPTGNSGDEYRWYPAYLLTEYPAYIGRE